jgi:hypothetical protein
MSSESVPSVEAPPAASEQTRAAPESADNVSSAQVRQSLRASEAARLAQTPAPAETVAPVAPAATEASTTTQPAEEVAATTTETTANPPATEAPNEPTDPAETPDDVLSQLSSLDPKSREIAEKAIAAFKERNQEKINKRIGKEVAKRGELERKLQEAQIREQALSSQIQRPAEQAAPPPTNLPGIPLSNIHTPQELVKLQQEAKQTIRFVDQALDRDDIDQGIQVGDRVFTKAELKERRFEARVVLEDQIPQRAAFLQQRDQAVQAAIEKFPFYKDDKSPEFKRAQEIIKESPALRNAPHYLEIVGKLVLGEQALEARKTAAATTPPKAAPKPKPPGDQTVSGAAAGGIERTAPGTRAEQALLAEREKIVANGNATSATVRQFLKKQDQLRNSR